MEYFDKIGDYLNGNLTKLEARDFEQQMEKDEELALAVRHYFAGEKVLQFLGEEELRAELRGLQVEKNKLEGGHSKDTGREGGRVVRMRPLRRALSIAAVGLVLVASGFLVVNHLSKGVSDEALFASNYQFPNVSQIRGTASESAYNTALLAYQRGDKGEATALLESIGSDDVIYRDVQYFLANIYLEEGEVEKVVFQLNELIESGDKRFVEDAQWQLIMAHLLGHETEKAESLIKEIKSNPDHAYYQKALELEAQLNSIWRKLSF